jgi:hypothetical protein
MTDAHKRNWLTRFPNLNNFDLKIWKEARHCSSHLKSQVLGRWRLGGSPFKASPQKVSINKPGMGIPSCDPSYAGDVDRRIVVQGCPWAKTQSPIQKMTNAKRAGGVLKW